MVGMCNSIWIDIKDLLSGNHPKQIRVLPASGEVTSHCSISKQRERVR